MHLKVCAGLLNLAGVLAFALAGCSNSASNQKEAGQAGDVKTLQIAVVPKGSTHNHWKRVHAGAEKAAQELGNVEIIWQGPQKEDDRQMQIQVVQNLVSRGVDAIMLAPLDDQSLVPSVKAAVSRKIPVVIFDSDLKSTEYNAFVATDNYAGGKLCARRLAELLGGKGNVIILKYSEGSDATIRREAGFLDGLKEFGPAIKLISSNQYAGATFEKAFQVSQNLLNRFEQFDGVFCSNETSTQGMLRALQVSGRAGKVKFVGFDVNETLLEGMAREQIHGLAVQDPIKMGYQGIKTAVAVIRGQPYEKRFDTGVTMVTQQNRQDPAIDALLHPEVAKYLKE